MDVTPIAEARSGLSQILADFRRGADPAPVVIGSHRRPEAVILPFDVYLRLSESAPVVVDLSRLRELRPVIERLAEASHLSDVRVFGSVARGDQTPDSDVDLLVAPADDATLFDVARFELDMEALLGVPVRAVSENALDASRDERLLRDLVSL